MNESQIEKTLMSVQSSSRTAVAMVVIGVVFVGTMVVFTGMKVREAARLQTKIEDRRDELKAVAQEIDDSRAAVDALKGELAARQAEFESLKANVEGLYAVHVTDANQVFEVKATAQATGKRTAKGPEFQFAAFINATPETLASIRQVTYRFPHDSFRDPVRVVKDRASAFRVEYTGWGCLPDVVVNIHLVDGSTRNMVFDMCKSLGVSPE
jgi:hypothetical protein